MTRLYKTQRCPKHANKSAHDALVGAGFRLHSYQTYQAGAFPSFVYFQTIDGMGVWINVDPAYASPRRAEIFFSEANGQGSPVWDGYGYGSLDRETLPLTMIRHAVAKWNEIRRIENGKQGRLEGARVAAMTALLTSAGASPDPMLESARS
jgi:hypothetical protein